MTSTEDTASAKKSKLGKGKIPPIQVLPWLLLVVSVPLTIFFAVRVFGASEWSSQWPGWTILGVFCTISTILILLINRKPKEGDDSPTELTPEQQAAKSKQEEETVAKLVWSSSALSWWWLGFVLTLWISSGRWPSFWGFLWEKNYLFTILTFFLILAFSSFRSKAIGIRDDKDDPDPQSAKPVFLAARLFVAVNVILWFYALSQTQIVQSYWEAMGEEASEKQPTRSSATTTNPKTTSILGEEDIVPPFEVTTEEWVRVKVKSDDRPVRISPTGTVTVREIGNNGEIIKQFDVEKGGRSDWSGSYFAALDFMAKSAKETVYLTKAKSKS